MAPPLQRLLLAAALATARAWWPFGATGTAPAPAEDGAAPRVPDLADGLAVEAALEAAGARAPALTRSSND